MAIVESNNTILRYNDFSLVKFQLKKEILKRDEHQAFALF